MERHPIAFPLMRSRVICSGLAGSLCGTTAASAQQRSSPALFLETVRDPGNTDVPPTGRSLALGGIRFGGGLADDAQASPAALMVGTGSDVVVSGGFFLYGRDELVNTPDQFPPRDPTRAPRSGSTTLPTYVAFATRNATWAGAAFYDGSATFEHTFDTATSSILFQATSDPFRNDGSRPAPPILSDCEPPRDDTLWFTGGIAYAWRAYEIAVGAGRSDMQVRWLADFRLRMR